MEPWPPPTTVPATGEFPEMGQHADEPHADSLGDKLNALRAAVLGANDGIVSVAGLVMGVAGATTDRQHHPRWPAWPGWSPAP